MRTQLRFYNVWLTRPSGEQLQSSQLWHRDREDFYILKVFIYLRDVGPGAGPFRYAVGTHRGRDRRLLPGRTSEGVISRTTDSELAAVVPPDRWSDVLGPRGTVVLADTRGLHCGGAAVDTERLLFTCMFTSQASQVREWFDRKDMATPPPELEFALRSGRRRAR